MKVLITGSRGYIGQRLLDTIKSILPNVETIEYDKSIKKPISDITTDQLKDVDICVHLAAAPRVESDPEEIKQTNIKDTTRLIKLCGQTSTNIIFASSCSVYGNAILPNSENDIPLPLSLYGKSKAQGEYVVKQTVEKFGINGVALRIFNVFGENQPINTAIGKFIYNAANKQDIYVNHMHQTRDFVYVGDVANIISFFIENINNIEKPFEIINVGSGTETQILNVARVIGLGLGDNVRILASMHLPYGHTFRHRADTKKLRNYYSRPLLTDTTDVTEWMYDYCRRLVQNV